MIRALIVGELRDDPQERTAKNGTPYATARASVPMGDAGRVSCSVVAFNETAVTRLLQMRAGASVALAGTLKVAIWQDRDGNHRPALDLVVDEVASTTPKPKKRKSTGTSEQPPASGRGPSDLPDDPFTDLPGAGDLDWMGA